MAGRAWQRSRQAMTCPVHVTVIAAVLLLSLGVGVRSDTNTKSPGKGNTFDFSEVDTDGSGCVQGPEEKQKFRLYIGGILKDSLKMSDIERALQAGRITHSADVNGDGKICECDLLTIFLTDSSDNGKRRHAFRVFEDGSIFDSVDEDSDGFLNDVKEKVGLTRKLAECVSDVKARTIVEAMSKLERDDGKLARSEYMLFLNSPHHIPVIPGPPMAYPSPPQPPGSTKMAGAPLPLLPSGPLQMGFPRLYNGARPVLPPEPVLPTKPVQNNPFPVQASAAGPVLPSRPVWAPNPVSSKLVENSLRPVESGIPVMPPRPVQMPTAVFEPQQVQMDARPIQSGSRPLLPPRPVLAPQNRPDPVQMKPRPLQDGPVKPQRLLPPQSMLLSDGTRLTFPQLPLAEDVQRATGGPAMPSDPTRPLLQSPAYANQRPPQSPFPQPPPPVLFPYQPPRLLLLPGTETPPGPRIPGYPVKQQGLMNQPDPVMQPVPPVQAAPVKQQPSSSVQANDVNRPEPGVQANVINQAEPVIQLNALNRPTAVIEADAMDQGTFVIPLNPSYHLKQQNAINLPSGPKIQLDLENQLNPMARPRPVTPPNRVQQPGSADQERPQKQFSLVNSYYTYRPVPGNMNLESSANGAGPLQSQPKQPAYQSAETGDTASQFRNQPARPVKPIAKPQPVNPDTEELERQLEGNRQRQEASHRDELTQRIYNFIQQSRFKLGRGNLNSRKKQKITKQSDRQPALTNEASYQPGGTYRNGEINQLKSQKLGSIPEKQEAQAPRVAETPDGQPSPEMKASLQQIQPQNGQPYGPRLPAFSAQGTNGAQRQRGQRNRGKNRSSQRKSKQRKSKQRKFRGRRLKSRKNNKKGKAKSSSFQAMA